MWCYIPPNQQVFCKYMNFSLLTKCLRGRMEMTSWAFYTWNDFVTPVYDEHRTCAPSVVHWHAVSIVFRTPIVVHRTKWSCLWGTLQGLAVIEAEKGFHHVIRLVVWSGEHFKAIAFCLQSSLRTEMFSELWPHASPIVCTWFFAFGTLIANAVWMRI